LVVREDGALLWEMEVVKPVGDNHAHPVMVHFRGEMSDAGLPF